MNKKRKTEDFIEKARGNIDSKYDLYASNIRDIVGMSNGKAELVCNAFLFGYSQGVLAVQKNKKK